EVEVDEPLLEISTDKVDTEIPSPVAGTLLEIVAEEDETVNVGEPLAYVGSEEPSAAEPAPQPTPAEPEAAEPEEPAEPQEPAEPEETAETGQAQIPEDVEPEPAPRQRTPEPAPAQEEGEQVSYVTPLVRKLA